MNFKEFYEIRRKTSEVAPIIELFASNCIHATLFGEKHGTLSAALLDSIGTDFDEEDNVGLLKVVAFDLEDSDYIRQLVTWSKESELPGEAVYEFMHYNTLDPNVEIEETDLLVLNTISSFRQASVEIRHLKNVRKFVVFLDTFRNWDYSVDDPSGEGLKKVVDDLLETGEWDVLYNTDFNDGVVVLERVLEMEEDDAN